MTNRRLLVLDDEVDFARFVSRVATTLGYEVEVTTHGYDFQAAIERVEPSVIMLDIVMPDIDGIELIQWLAQRGTRARVIVVTGSAPRNATIAAHLGTARMLGKITTLLKPVSITDLTLALSAHEDIG